MNANIFPEILPADLDAARRFLFSGGDETIPTPPAPRPRPRPTQSAPVVRNGITRARTRPATPAVGDA